MMSRAARVKSYSGIYHVMLRGANRQEIFHDEEDRLKFLDILERYKVNSDMSVYAWCLMDNHVHLLLREGREGLSLTMKRIGVSYVWYYNWKYSTTGHLFQDRFKSENVETDQYLLTVVRYIHQNPIKAEIVSRLEEWRWSSYLGFYGNHFRFGKLLDKEFILNKFSADRSIAESKFKEFNERNNHDDCLDESENKRRRMSDEEARTEIKDLLGGLDIAQVKSLPRKERTEILQKVKTIKGLSQRQAARIIGVSHNLIFRA
jgi:putative transposase